jgi:hypothetical protein
MAAVVPTEPASTQGDKSEPAQHDALAAARAISNEKARAEVLTALAPQALAAARKILDESIRAYVLALLAPHLPKTERADALREALAATRTIFDDRTRAEVLTTLAPHLPETLLPNALAAARAISDEGTRARVLATLAPRLTDDLPTPHQAESAPKSQFFIVRIVGNEDQPDVEILTLPAGPHMASMSDFEQLEREVLHGETFPTIAGSSIDSSPNACLAALHQVILDGGIREGLFWNPEHYAAYARDIFSTQPVILMNSPISGSTLAQLVGAAGWGTAAAFMAAFPNPDVGHVMIYFVLVGGTRIVLGAADGISIALKQGLSHILLKWMGAPASTASELKRTRSASSSSPKRARKIPS